MGDFWIFGYGSLIWNPGFEFLEEQKARLYGRSRALCVHSFVHRGTREKPGLVLGLDAGGSCIGVARKASGQKRDRIIAYLRERELVTDVYIETWVKVLLENGERVDAVTYVADRNHEQYAGDMNEAELLSRVQHANGKSGNNIDYIKNTILSLQSLGIHDYKLEHFYSRLKALRP